MKKITLGILVTLFAVVFVTTEVSSQVPESSQNMKPYLVGPRDKVKTDVMGEENFSFEAYVDEAGNFYVPYDEEPIHARCKTEQQIRKEVTERISRLVRNPMVNFAVIERRKTTPVTVFGQVKTPSTVELYREASLMEILATVGGQTEDAGGIVRVFRPQIPMCADNDVTKNWRAELGDKLDVPFKVYDLASIQSGSRESNPVIYPGDIVFVDKALPVYINGEVTQPRGIYLKEGGLSLASALAMVGGPRPDADLKSVSVFRRKEGSQNREMIQINLKDEKENQLEAFMLKPYDEVVIGKKKKSILQLIMDTALKTGMNSISQIGYSLPRRILY